MSKRKSLDKMRNNYSNHSEIIINNILNKIISLTISRSIRQKAEKNLPNRCYNFIKKTVTNYLEIFYLPHDKDELINNIEVNNNSIFPCDLDIITPKNINKKNNLSFSDNINDTFFNNAYDGENNWDLIKEPNSGKLDRYSSNFINYQPIYNELRSKFNIEENGIVMEEDDEDSNKLLEEKSKILKASKEKSEKNVKSIKKISYFKSGKKTNDNISETNKEKKRNINEIMNQFSFHDIVDLQQTLSNKEIAKLRKEYEQHKRRESIELQALNEYKLQLMNKQKLNFDTKKYTGKKINIDHNGQIIFIKDIKEKDLISDFSTAKSQLKIKSDYSENKSEKRRNIKKLNIFLSNTNNSNTEKETNNNSIIKNINKPQSPNKNYGRHQIIKLNKELEFPKKDVEKPVILFGSSFPLMNMECGVILKEEKKMKSGGLDFYTKYKKFSIQTYDKKLKEAEATNSFLKTHIEINSDNLKNTESLINKDHHTNFTQNLTSSFINNSQKTLSDIDLRNMNVNNSKYFYSTNNSSMFKSYINNLHSSKNFNRNQSNIPNHPFIKVSVGSSLMDSFDKLNLLSTDDIKNNIKRNNIFRRKGNNKLHKNFNSLEDINQFNKEIITGKNWSNNNGTKTSLIPKKNPEKPGNLQISREMGLKGKNLRNRNKFVVPLKSLFLETENFFKKLK